MRASTGIVLALLLALCAALGYWLHQNIESYDAASPVRFSAKALRDPYLAAQYFLQDFGTPVYRDSLQKQLNTLPKNGSVVLTTPSNLLTERQAAALRHWMQHGGHLLVIAGSDSPASPDPLLRPFGVRRKFTFSWPGKISADKTRNGKSNVGDATRVKKLSERLRELNRQIEIGTEPKKINRIDSGDLTEVTLEGSKSPLHIRFDPNFQLQHKSFTDDRTDHSPAIQPFYRADFGGRVHLAQFEVGQGLLTVVSDMEFLTSSEIGRYDHALALSQLVDTRRGISLVSDVDMPALPKLLWQWAREPIIAAIVALLVGVWFRARRFGPVSDPQLQGVVDALLDGLIQNWRLDPNGFDLVKVGPQALDAYLAGLAA